jgi:hypothetical protein
MCKLTTPPPHDISDESYSFQLYLNVSVQNVHAQWGIANPMELTQWSVVQPNL